MTIPASGQISVDQVNTELNASADAAFSLGDQHSRALANQRAGQFSFDEYHGRTMDVNVLGAGTLSGDHGYFAGFYGTLDPTTIAGFLVQGILDDPNITRFVFQTSKADPKAFYNAIRIFGAIDKTMWFEDAVTVPNPDQVYWEELSGMLAPNGYFVYTYY